MRFHAVAGLVHANDGTGEVNVHAELPKVSVAEHFHVWRQEILQFEQNCKMRRVARTGKQHKDDSL